MLTYFIIYAAMHANFIQMKCIVYIIWCMVWLTGIVEVQWQQNLVVTHHVHVLLYMCVDQHHMKPFTDQDFVLL